MQLQCCSNDIIEECEMLLMKVDSDNDVEEGMSFSESYFDEGKASVQAVET